MAEGTPKGERAVGRGRLYRALVSVKTSLIFLGFFAFLFLLGTVFPQSTDLDRLDRYREAGGKFVAAVGWFDLLNLFHTWYFTLGVSLFAFHLLLCSIHRLGILRRRPLFRPFSREELLRRDHSFSVSCQIASADLDIEGTLRKLGFKRPRYYSEDAHLKRLVCEKGFPFRWMSWLYHICILAAIGGFCVTYLLAFEGYQTIAVGERAVISLSSHSTKWRELAGLFGIKQPRGSRQVEIELERFITEHTQRPSLQYPDEPLKRFWGAWGRGNESIGYSINADSVYPRDWFSVLNVYENGDLVRRKRIEVNDPLRYEGLTLYQIGYEYEFDLEVGGETLTGILTESPFVIPQMEGEFLLRTPRLGTLFRYDGRVEMLAPSAKLQYRPPAGQGDRRWTTVARMVVGQPAKVMRTDLVFRNLRESSVLGYRLDPGVPLLWASTVMLMVVMALRIYLPWYQVRCHVDDSSGRTLVTVSIRMVGLFASPEQQKQKLCAGLRG